MSCRSFYPQKPVFSGEASSKPAQAVSNLEEYPFIKVRTNTEKEFQIKILSINSNWQTFPGNVKIIFGFRFQVQIDDETVVDKKWGPLIPTRTWLSVANKKIRIGTGDQINTQSQVASIDTPVEWEHPEVFPYLSRIKLSDGQIEQVDFCMTQNSTPIPMTEPLNKRAGWIFLILFLFVALIMLTRK